MKNHFTETKILRPVIYDELDHSIEGYIHPGEILFVNWESINKDNAVMVRETELSASLYDITRRTQEDNGIPIIVIIDEEHMFGSRNAKKSEKVLSNICPNFRHTSAGIYRKGRRAGYSAERKGDCGTDDKGKRYIESHIGV